jgi:cytochrome c peroxidase
VKGGEKLLKIVKLILLALIIVGLLVLFAFAAGDVSKGKSLFNDPKLGGGMSGKSCNSCHPSGKGLEKSAMKKEWQNPAGTWLSLEDANNVCIILALKGKAIDPKGQEMKDLVAYIKSLAKKM